MMSSKLLVACCVAMTAWTTDVRVEPVVVLERETAPVLRSESDGLDAIVRTHVAFGASHALAACNFWDVRETCCPAGCAARNGPQWPRADAILQGCMRALGCPENDVRSATVFMKCDCPR